MLLYILCAEEYVMRLRLMSCLWYYACYVLELVLCLVGMELKLFAMEEG